MAFCERCHGRIRRNTDIEDYFRSGMTLDAIGLKFGISRERVRQILKTLKVPPKHGGQTLRAIENVKEREFARRKKMNKRVRRIYGCSFELALDLNKGHIFSAQGSRARCYLEQRRNSITRGIRWEINFPDWCRLWDESGKWEERGRGKNGYCMSRVGDSGPYKIGNVEIVSNAENIKDSFMITPGSERYAKSERPARDTADPTGMTPRIKEAWELICQGKTVTEVAVILNVQRRTAWQYAYNARRKMALLKEAA